MFVGYSRLTGDDEEGTLGALKALLAAHIAERQNRDRRLVRQCMRRHGHELSIVSIDLRQ